MEESQENIQNSKKIKENNSSEDGIINKVFLFKYMPVKKIGSGSFASVYKAESGDECFAMKFERRSNEYEYLEDEAIIMRYLKCPQIPVVKCFGKNMEYNIMVMELLGDSLEFNFTIKKKFSVKTVAMIGYQILSILEFIHDKLGLAKKFRSSKTLMQYPYIRKKKMTGTARYASIHAMEEMEQSRRDDLESTAYVLLYFLRGSLPWQGLKIKSKENRYKKIMVKKKEIKSEELCETFPEEFKYFVDYVRNLGYTENPDYEKLRNNFLVLVKEKMCRNFDFIYDWTTKSDIQQRDDSIDILNGNFGGNKNNQDNKNNEENKNTFNDENNKENQLDNTNNNLEGNKNLNNNTNNNINDNNLNNNINNDNNKATEKVETGCCFVF